MWSSRRLALPALLTAAVTGTAAFSGWQVIRIHSGDTVWALAHRYHVSVQTLVRVNHLAGDGNLIYVGQSLRVPGQPAAAGRDIDGASHESDRDRASRTKTVVEHYRVQLGDYLYGISKRFGVSPSVIVRANHLPSSLVVQLGQVLAIPKVVPVRPPAVTLPLPRQYPAWVTQAAARHRAELAYMRVPSFHSVRSLIVRVAHAMHVDPALALGIARQESGFNQREVSGADAIGVMQVIPSTGDFIGRYLLHRHINLLDTTENVVAGVALLRALTSQASLPNAIGGYYQGLSSVLSRGMYADTKQYVADVLALRNYYAARVR